MDLSDDPKLAEAGEKVKALLDNFEFEDAHILLANSLLARPDSENPAKIMLDPDMSTRLSQLLCVMCMKFTLGEHCLICALGEAIVDWPKAEIINILKMMEIDEGRVRPYVAEDIEAIGHASACLGVLSYQLFKRPDFLGEVLRVFLETLGARVHYQSSPTLN